MSGSDGMTILPGFRCPETQPSTFLGRIDRLNLRS